MKILAIDIETIRIDGGTQMRAEINQDTVEEYRQKMADGEEFPAVAVFDDGCERWLADGFHRYYAAKAQGSLKILAELRDGSLRDAILYAVGANGQHGLHRTNADKRRAVECMMLDEKVRLADNGKPWSDREISRRCMVSAPLVAEIRKRFSAVNSYSDDRAFVDRHGNTSTMDTSNIGRKSQTEKTVINGDTGEIIDNPIVETVSTKPFHKPATPDESDTGIGVVFRRGGNAPNAMKPIHAGEAAPDTTVIHLPRDAERAAACIIEIFGSAYAASLASAIASFSHEQR